MQQGQTVQARQVGAINQSAGHFPFGFLPPLVFDWDFLH